MFLHISIFFGSISIAYTLEQYLENCITFPPLPQNPSITEQFFTNFAVYSAIISGVTDHQPILIFKTFYKRVIYFHYPLKFLHHILNNNNIFDSKKLNQELNIYYYLLIALV